MNFELGKTYVINPEFDPYAEGNSYKLSRFNKEEGQHGLYFHHFVDGIEVSNSAYFSAVELENGILIEAEEEI